MYVRAVRLNPTLAEGFNNLGSVLRILKNDSAAIEAYQRALTLNPQLVEASYNLAMMLAARGDFTASIEAFRQTVLNNPAHGDAWEALYRGLMRVGRQEEAIQVFLDWESSAELSPEMVSAGLALCRPMGDRARESRYLSLAIAWPFTIFTPEQYAPILGMIQYFDLSRKALFGCYQRYDDATSARAATTIPLLSRRSADLRLRIGYVSGDFRQHVMGRMMLDVIAHHDRNRFSILLISTCARTLHDDVTAKFRQCADGFADVSALDDFAAAKSIAEADIDVLVDLAGHTNSARPGIYVHQPARSIVTHLGFHGCLGLSAVYFKLTDRVADLADAASYQIEKPYRLDNCVFPFVRVSPSAVDPGLNQDLNLLGKFVFGAFLNVLKLSPRCLTVWRHVLEALPEAILLFSPLEASERFAIERVTAAAGIDASRIAILYVTDRDETCLRARYRLVHAVLDTFPYAGGDTTLAALDMGVPVVSLAGERHSERVGASILSHLGLDELIAESAEGFVAIAEKLARNSDFMAKTRQKIVTAFAAATTNAETYTRALEKAFVGIAAQKPITTSMTLTARQFFQTLHDAIRRQRVASSADENRAIAAIFAELRDEQPDYPPLLRAQGELAQSLDDQTLAGDCLAALLKQFPGDVDARLTLAGFLIDQYAAAEALQVIEDALVPSGTNARVLKLQARAYGQLSQWETARQFSAVAVDIAPADVQALFWHGTILSHLGETEGALNYLNRTLILAPDHAEAAYNAGVILAELGNHVDAEKVFRRALGTPAARLAHVRLLQALRAGQRRAEWLIEAQRFADTYSGIEYSRMLESRIARYRGDINREAEILLPLSERAVMIEDDVVAFELISELLAILPFHDVSPHLLQRLQERYKVALAALHPYPPVSDSFHGEPAKRRVRLGYLVDLSLPFVRDLIVALASHYDRDRIAMTVYVTSPADLALREQIAAAGAGMVFLAGMDELRAAENIRGDDMDIMIVATGFGTYAKPGLLSHHLAPLQFGMPGFTTPAGVGELNYRLSDRVLDLASDAEPMLPAPWLVDGCVLPVVAAPPTITPFTRASLNVSDNVPVFGVLASVERISQRTLGFWKALSDRVPEAVFLVCPLDAEDIEPIRKIILVSGIGGTRILSLPTSFRRPRDLSLATLIDVILDTVPGSDYSSARAALVEGIPIVTMPGRMPDERVALTLLSHAGETSTVAASGRDYVDIAAKFATNEDIRSAWTARIKALWQRTPPTELPLSMQNFTLHHEAAVFRAIDACGKSRASIKARS